MSAEEREKKHTEADRVKAEKEYFQNSFPAILDLEIPSEQFGVENLRNCLIGILHSQVKSTFSPLAQTLHRLRFSCDEKFKKLGSFRDGPSQKKAYLRAIQGDYGSGAGSLLDGVSNGTKFLQDPSMLWRTVRHVSDLFAVEIRKDMLFDKLDWEYHVLRKEPTGPEDVSFELRHSIYNKIKHALDNSQGRQKKYDNPLHLKKQLFEQQSSTWEETANKYFDYIIQQINKCNDQLFRLACPDSEIRCRLQDHLEQAGDAAIARAKDELTAIIGDRHRQPRTYDDRFDEALKAREEARQQRLDEAERAIDSGKVTYQNKETLHADRRIFMLHEWLSSYMLTAIPRFVDNVTLQVVERHLLSRTGPLGVFSPKFVEDLSDEDVEAIMSEDKKKKMEERERLKQQVAALDEAIKEAKSLSRR